MDEKRLFRFGDFTLDISQGMLYRRDERLRLPPKLFELLSLLVERRGAIITHSELIRTLWPNTVVEECGLSRNVSMLRKYLSPDGGARYIENIPKRGYRFAAEVIEVREPSHVPVKNPLRPSRVGVAFDERKGRSATDARSTVPASGAPRRGQAALLLGLGVVASLVLTVFASHERRVEPEFRLKPVTTNAAELPVLSAAVSPDARYLAYVESGSSGGSVFVRLLDSPRTHVLQSPPDVVPSTIRWYADSTHLLLGGFDPRAREYVVWSTSVLGEPASVVLTNAYKPAISPDGKAIAFYRNRNELWLASIDGGSQRLFATAPNAARYTLQPQFSADGKYLVVGRTTDKAFMPIIEAHRLADGHITQLFEPQDHAVLDMLLLPSDELIVSALHDYTKTRLLSLKIDFAGGKVGAVQTAAQVDGRLHRLASSADGSVVTVVRDSHQTDIYIGAFDAFGEMLSEVRRLTFDDAWDRPSVWLADSRTILFHSNRHGSPGIYKQRIDSVHAEPLVVDERHNFWPVVSPDQQWLWYFSSPPGPPSLDAPVTLMRRPLAGGPAQEFDSRSDFWRGLRCAQSGTCIRAEHEGDQTIFYSFHPSDGSGRELARVPWVTGSSYYYWDVSPDGKRIAFVDRIQNTIGLLALDTKPAQRTDVKIEGYQSLQALSWDVSGEGLYVACFDEDDSSTLHVSLTGKVRLLRYQPLHIGGWASPSPDGRHLLISDWTRASNVWLLEMAPR